MSSALSKLPASARKPLLDDLNYLNMAEIKAFCKRTGIPYAIHVQTKEGTVRATSEEDRKGVVLERIRHFLKTGRIPPATCFPASVLSPEPLPAELSADDKLCYGQYDKRNRHFMTFLADLTGGNFRDGAMARILLRDFWGRGKAPTLREFASARLQAVREHSAPNPEWAFLSDRARRTAPADWKKMRARKAAKVIKTLQKIISAPRNAVKERASK